MRVWGLGAILRLFEGTVAWKKIGTLHVVFRYIKKKRINDKYIHLLYICKFEYFGRLDMFYL